jgi:hypothetical protein
MGLTTTVKMRNEVHNQLRFYIEGIKVRTKNNLNDGAVDAEGFFRNLLNLLYGFDLSKEKIEGAYNDTIDLHSLEKKICVQVTAQNNKSKVDGTIKHFIKKNRFELYNELHFMILDRERSFEYDFNKLESCGVTIVFHDITTIFNKLQTEFDSYDKMVIVYDFVMKELDNEYAQKANEKSKSKVQEEMVGKHIVDQLYTVLKMFDGFTSIHPRTLSKLYPFNTEKRTYKAYSHYCLKTNNVAIHELLQKVSVNENKEIEIHDESLLPFAEKLKEIFTILNYSLVRCIAYREKYTEIKHHKIWILKSGLDCACNQCQYQQFNLQALFSHLKEKHIIHSHSLNEALSEGYYLCKLGEHIKGWQVFYSVARKSVEAKQPIIHFFAQHNILAIYNFVDSPWWGDEAKAIIPKILEIDLHNSISQLEIPLLIRDELIRVKEDYHLHYSREIIEEQAESIHDIKYLYARGGHNSGSSAPDLIIEEIYLLFHFYTSNNIIFDDFNPFKATITKAIDTLFDSYTTEKRYEYGYKKFDCFIITMMIFYVDEDSIKRIFAKYKIEHIEMLETEKLALIKVLINFFANQYTINSWEGPKFYIDIKKQEYFSHFRQLIRHIYNRVMLILSKITLSIEVLTPLTGPFTDFLQAAEDMNHVSWELTAQFLKNHIKSFSEKQIQSILESILSENHHRNSGKFFVEICESAAEKASFIIKDQTILSKLFNKVSTVCQSCNIVHDFTQILAFWNITDEKGQRLIREKAIEYLNKTFDPDFYQQAVWTDVFNKHEQTGFLDQYIGYAEKHCNGYDLKQESGRWVITNFTGYNCINCLYYLQVDLQDERIQAIAKKSNYYNWLINFKDYDYSNFDLGWLTDACPYYLKLQLSSVENLKKKVSASLAKKYNEKLAEFYFKYLQEKVGS